jgi:hypothetical protein
MGSPPCTAAVHTPGRRTRSGNQNGASCPPTSSFDALCRLGSAPAADGRENLAGQDNRGGEPDGQRVEASPRQLFRVYLPAPTRQPLQQARDGHGSLGAAEPVEAAGPFRGRPGGPGGGWWWTTPV